VAASRDKEERRLGWLPTRLNTIAGIVTIFEGEFGDTGFVEIAEAFGDHAVVLFLGRAGQRQINPKHPRASSSRKIESGDEQALK
jgi:hypothetical protein